MIKVELNDYHITDNFEDQLFERLTAKELLKVITLLPAGYRAVLNLYILEGYSHQDISEILNISVNTSKSQLHKGKAKMRSLLEELHPELVKKYIRKVEAK